MELKFNKITNMNSLPKSKGWFLLTRNDAKGNTESFDARYADFTKEPDGQYAYYLNTFASWAELDLDVSVKSLLDSDSEISLSDAADRIFDELRADKDYYFAWQSNIACAIYDEWRARHPNTTDSFPFERDVHLNFANACAKRFLDLLITVTSNQAEKQKVPQHVFDYEKAVGGFGDEKLRSHFKDAVESIEKDKSDDLDDWNLVKFLNKIIMPDQTDKVEELYQALKKKHGLSDTEMVSEEKPNESWSITAYNNCLDIYAENGTPLILVMDSSPLGCINKANHLAQKGYKASGAMFRYNEVTCLLMSNYGQKDSNTITDRPPLVFGE